MKPLVYITRLLPNEIVGRLEEVATVKMWDRADVAVPRETLLTEAREATALLTMLTEQIDEQLMNECQQLKIVANMAVGYDNIDITFARKKGIITTNTPDVLTNTTADLTFALLMATARRLPEAAKYIEANEWNTWSPFQLAGTDVHHKTLGIFGMGRIGEAVAKRAYGFDMAIKYHNRSRNEQAEKEYGVVYCEFDELIETSDYIVCLAPLTEETTAIFNENAFAKMKKSAIFINASRGGLVDEKALYSALTNGEIARAGLDVFQNEPIDSEHPLVTLDNVVALPHIGSATVETRTEMISLAVRNIYTYLKEGTAITPIQ